MIKKMSGSNQTEKAVNMMLEKKAEVLKDQFKEPWIKFNNGKFVELRPINSRNFNWLRYHYYETYNKTIKDDTLKTAVETFAAIATNRAKKEKLHLRVAEDDSAIYYDLCNDKWQQIIIKPGRWEILEQKDSPILFKRYQQMNEQTIAKKSSIEDVKKLLDFVNIDKKSREAMFLLIYIATDFIPNIPHAVLHLKGIKGTAKSNLSRIIKRIVDPATPELITLNKDLEQNLAHNWLPFFDNISRINKKESDILCRASTGAGIAKRKLFKDDQDIFYNIKHCVAMNGIGYNIPKSDLMDRSIIIELDPISSRNRLTEYELHKRFEEERPSIVSGFFDLIAKAMEIKETLEFKHYPRMADFFEWGTAIAIALGYDREYFESSYFDMIHDRLESFHNPSGFIKALKLYVEDNGAIRASASEVLDIIKGYAEKLNIEIEDPLPVTWVTRKINNSIEYLNDMNINFERGKDRRGARFIHLFR
jgi:uncharacterized protein YlbG (UPF0298 family)